MPESEETTAAGKEYADCPFCGRSMSMFRVVKTQTGNWQISCPCGVMTKLFRIKEELQECWNSRPGRPFKASRIRMKYPPTRGIEPGTRNAVTQKELARRSADPEREYKEAIEEIRGKNKNPF